jgi:hypothetical protein
MTRTKTRTMASESKRVGSANRGNAGELLHRPAKSAAEIPGEPAKVAMIIVDTVGSEVPLSGEEGNCVQWR